MFENENRKKETILLGANSDARCVLYEINFIGQYTNELSQNGPYVEEECVCVEIDRHQKNGRTK